MQWVFPYPQNWEDVVFPGCLTQSQASFWWLLSVSHVPVQATKVSEGLQLVHWHIASEREQGSFLSFINIWGSKFNDGFFMHASFQLSLLPFSSRVSRTCLHSVFPVRQRPPFCTLVSGVLWLPLPIMQASFCVLMVPFLVPWPPPTFYLSFITAN